MVRATPSGSSAKPFSRSAETGSSVAATIAAACPRASSRLTEPSRRPSVAANPELVVASAWKPSAASSFADPWSHGFGSSSGSPGRCSSRNRSAFSCWVVMARRYPGRQLASRTAGCSPSRSGHISRCRGLCSPGDHFPGRVTDHKWSRRVQSEPAYELVARPDPPSQVTSVTLVGFVDVAEHFPGC